MGKKIFITYGDKLYASNVLRICNMAKQTNHFDEIISYGPKDLPQEILTHTLFQYARGGGYWLWKPYIIQKTLEECNDDDIVVYVDSGSEVYKDDLWQTYFNMMKKSNAIVFKFCCLMKYWTKKSVLDKFRQDCRNIHQLHQICGGVSLWSRKALPVVKEWYKLMYEHPDLVSDTPPDKLKFEAPYFKEHRHDQAILTCLAYKYEKEYGIQILWEKSEVFYSKGQAVFLSRIRNKNGVLKGREHKPVSLIWRMRHFIVNTLRDIRQFLYKYLL